MIFFRELKDEIEAEKKEDYWIEKSPNKQEINSILSLIQDEKNKQDKYRKEIMNIRKELRIDHEDYTDDELKSHMEDLLESKNLNFSFMLDCEKK